MSTQKTGTIGWVDLTVPDAEKIREFYQQVVGWKNEPLDMGGYNDHSMIPADGSDPVAGICHTRGVNTQLPPVWLIYITVDDLEASMAACQANNGTILIPPKGEKGSNRFCVIKDPAGAVAALYEQAK
ncbi:VOC family protein [candidate division KSB1 bacterium]|nr:VOC family protein [candidate division KSB1 bacterium]